MKSLLYPSPLMTAPRVMIVDVPARWRGETLPLGRYYPIIIETDAERDEVMRAIDAGWEEGVGPGLLDDRPSNLWSDRVLISRYDPSLEGWPWVAVTRWPNSFCEVETDLGAEMARGCYTIELFATAAEVDAHCAALLDGLARRFPIEVRILSADTISPAGSA